MEINTNIIIVGAGISGLDTALALHRLGIRSLVLESSDKLRAAGFGLGIWTNAWNVLDALGIGNTLRQRHCQLFGGNDHDFRCVRRKELLEALANELPSGTIRYSSKLVSIEESGFSKLVHLADGSIFKTKVLIGCDGVNSLVAKWLGFKRPSLTGRSAIRGCAYYKEGHGLESQFQLFVGSNARCGVIPCDNTAVYWFFSSTPSTQESRRLQEADQLKLKQFVLTKLGKVPDQIRSVIEDTRVEEIVRSSLGYRPPLQILFGNISKGNVCVAGDAFHPMTPDLGQGGCSSLEDGIILAKCLADALRENSSSQRRENDGSKDEYKRIESGLKNYAKKRRWRAFDLITTSYVLGWMQEFDGFGIRFLREKILSANLSGFLINKADVDPTQFTVCS
ncbi:hypothetical protein BVRB_9g213800 [Beta vulgaris subsp. vulgaris]|nr:hypothetical protein BVRB_9g213800 [Beta vulgaris subsp. vulgaris]